MKPTTLTTRHLTTKQFAEAINNEPGTIRSRLCKTGSFYGVKPIKLPSGRLLWAAGDLQALLNDEGV